MHRPSAHWLWGKKPVLCRRNTLSPARSLHSCKGRGQVEGSRASAERKGDSSLTLKLPSPAQPGSGYSREPLWVSANFPTSGPDLESSVRRLLPGRAEGYKQLQATLTPRGKQPGGDSSIDSAPCSLSFWAPGEAPPGTVATSGSSNEAHSLGLGFSTSDTAGVLCPQLAWRGPGLIF